MKNAGWFDARLGTPLDTGAEEAGPQEAAMPRALLRLFDAFDRAKLRWALLRPWQGLLCEEGDIDILLGHAELASARQILADAGFLAMSKDGPDLHAVASDRTSGRFLWVHVQPELKAAGLAVPARNVPSDIHSGPFPEVAGGWMLLTLLVRCLARGEVPERYRQPLRKLAAGWRGGPAVLESHLRAQGFDPAQLAAAAASGDWANLLRMMPPRDEAGRPPPSARARAWRFIRASLMPQRQGLCVAVIGADGSGKSTLLAGLARSLPLPTRTIYMGLTGGNMRKALELRIPGLVFAAQLAVLWERFGRAIFHSTVGRIVLFDRYVLDGAVPPGRPMSRARRMARWLQRWLVPMPDLVLLLDASGQTMHGRKGEYTPEILEEVRSCYRKVGARISNLAVIDAERPADEVLCIAQGLVWQRLRRRRLG